jgi:hypothetical protein
VPRFRVRTLMIVVGVIAFILGAIGPGRQAYRRWTYHRDQIARFAKFESRERAREASEANLASDREAIRTTLMTTPKFSDMSPEELEKNIDAHVTFHRSTSKQAKLAAEQWAEQRRTSEVAIWSSLDPFAPEVR